MPKKVTIIGAGMAGLSTGCYLQMNGYDTEIFELNNTPGGLCTSWKRDGYIFDGCIHSISGLNPKFRANRHWNELIDFKKIKFVYHDNLGAVEDENGKIATLYADPDKLRSELLSIAPDDKTFIDSLVAATEKLGKYDFTFEKPLELWSPLDYYLRQFKIAPVFGLLFKWRGTLEDVIKSCKSEKLKTALNLDFFSRFPAYFLLASLGSCHSKNIGYPIGGSLVFARLLESRYQKLGGKIHYGSKVVKVNTENDVARGIILESGETKKADVVISAADGHYTIFEMLQGKYINDKIKKLYDEHPKWPSMVLVSLGIARTFENEPSSIELHLKESLVVDEKSKLKTIVITIYNFDPTLSPKGKTCVKVILKTDNFRYWDNLKKNDAEKYKREKVRITQEIIKILDRRFGNIANNIEVIDVATPVTFYKNTNNWNGSTQGWVWLPGLIPESIKKSLPKLKNFYMIGQWTAPGGGVFTSFQSGRDIAQIICKKDQKRFKIE